MEKDKVRAQGGAAFMEAPAEKPEEKPAEQPAAVQPAEMPEVKKEEVPVAKKEEAPAKPKKQGRTFLYTFVVCLYAVLVKILFFMKIEGKENVPKGPCVLMGNHQTLFDPVTLALCAMDREIHFMGKKELFEIPVLGWCFRRVHGFPVDRGNMDMGAVRTALGVLKDGNTLGIFPEGTRSKTGYMLPLLGGASLIALKSGCDVVPVYIDGNYKPFRRIVVRVGKPIDTKAIQKAKRGKEAVDELTGRMEQSFFELSGGKSRAPEAQNA